MVNKIRISWNVFLMGFRCPDASSTITLPGRLIRDFSTSSSSLSFAYSKPTMAQPLPQDIEDLHMAACDEEQETYIDPHTGYMVFTAYGHWRRGKCCGSQCRHCPYDYVNVRKSRRPRRPSAKNAC